MTRALRVIDGDDPHAVLQALREALAGGPAILPQHGSTRPAAQTPLPSTVSLRVSVVVETSGSTGTPKRVALGADALLASAAASQSALGGPGQWLLALPAHYIAGINVLVRSIVSETVPVMMPPGRFDPFAFAVTVDSMESGPGRRFTSLVPAQLSRLIETDELLDTLRGFDRILVGGQAMPQELLARAIELGLNVTRTYGSSETSGGCVYDGVPFANVVIAITDGEVELGGPTLAEGYLGDELRTEAAFFEREGIRWYRTGDTGEIVDGVLRVTGRLDDVIASGGVKISLTAVEKLVAGIPGLSGAVVVAAPSPEWGEVPVVVSPVATDLAELRQAVERELGKPARPQRVVVLAEIPRLPSGKPDRVALREIVRNG